MHYGSVPNDTQALNRHSYSKILEEIKEHAQNGPYSPFYQLGTGIKYDLPQFVWNGKGSHAYMSKSDAAMLAMI